MTDQEKVTKAEELRIECEKQISEILERNVALVSHVFERERGENHDLARAAFECGWHIFHNKSWWLEVNGPNGAVGRTVLFVGTSHQRQHDSAGNSKVA